MLKRITSLAIAILMILSSVFITEVFAAESSIEAANLINQTTITGNLRYHYRADGSVQNSTIVSAPNIPVMIIVYDDTGFFISSQEITTDVYGHFRATFDNSTWSNNISILVIAFARDEASFIVSSQSEIRSFHNAYNVNFPVINTTTRPVVPLGDLVIPEEISGAFNILRFTRQGFEFLRSSEVPTPPRIPIVWYHVPLGHMIEQPPNSHNVDLPDGFVYYIVINFTIK